MAWKISTLIGILLKGVFNTNPPLKKLCPQWDVGVVLDFLKKEPFVLVDTCSLKFLTLKVCFLLAITSARRTDDKLSIAPSKCRILHDKVILVPDMLIKQDRPAHVGIPIEVEAFENEHLCLVKLLPRYLTKVEELRQEGCDSLFLTFVRPHRRPTSQTISRWLVQLIKLAHEASLVPVGKVTGHSTRALSPSWAEFRGVAVSEIIRVADWASAKTYYQFYRKQIPRSLTSSVLSVSRSDDPDRKVVSWLSDLCHKSVTLYEIKFCLNFWDYLISYSHVQSQVLRLFFTIWLFMRLFRDIWTVSVLFQDQSSRSLV